MCVLVYRKQLQLGNSAYTYQIFVSTNQAASQLHQVVYILVYHFWSGIYVKYAGWFTGCYLCMWYAAHLITSLSNIFGFLEILFGICITADRILALTKPFLYKNLNHKRHQTFAFLISLFISTGASIFDCFRLDVASDSDLGYRTVYNLEYMQGIGAVLIQASTAIRLFITAILFVLNSVMIYFYRTKFLTQAKLVFTDKSERKRKDNEKTLIILSLCQSCFIFLDTCGTLVAYMLFYVAPYAYTCGDVAAYCFYIAQWAVRAVDFYLLSAVSKPFRAMVIQAIPFLGICRNRVDTVATGTTPQ